MQKIKLKTEESGKKLLAAYAPPKWSETADDDDEREDGSNNLVATTPLLAFDFDHTIVQLNTDVEVIKGGSGHCRFNHIAYIFYAYIF